MGSQRGRSPTRVLCGIVVALGLLGFASWILWFRTPDATRSEQLLMQARIEREAGDIVRAEELAAEAAGLVPDSAEAAIVAAECAVNRQRFQEALRYLSLAEAARRTGACSNEPDARLAALEGGILHLQIGRFSEAEAAYRRALAVAPLLSRANDGLARLLGLCGRRHEAIPFILQLIRSGEDTDLVVLLLQESGRVNEDALLTMAQQKHPEDSGVRLAVARVQSEQPDLAGAVHQLKQLVQDEPDFTPARAELLRLLVASGETDELARWTEPLGGAGDRFPEFWNARATLAEASGDVAGAIRCYWESLSRRPESRETTYRLARLLERAAAPEAPAIVERLSLLYELEVVQQRAFETATNSRSGEMSPLVALAEKLRTLGRFWEALALVRTVVSISPATVSDSAGQLLRTLETEAGDLPLEQTAPAFNPGRAIDLSRFALPIGHRLSPSPDSKRDQEVTQITFRDDAAAAQLPFRFHNRRSDEKPLHMFHFTGGGIGVVDFDSDGAPDVVFSQGLDEPRRGAARNFSGPSDALFRNIDGKRFEDVSQAAHFDERDSGLEFGQGVTVGDFNSDGFPDVYMANIGRNALWMNQGDGTFTNVTVEASLTDTDWTSSCLMADLNGDGLPDLYNVNYLTGDDVFDRVCQQPDGSRVVCKPIDFPPAPDRLLLNSGAGQFVDASNRIDGVKSAGPGLGIAAWDADESGRLSLFIANDAAANFFLVRDDSNGEFLLNDRSIASGLALNTHGKAEACMGVALGDVDNNGGIDVHITNFLSESNTIYLQQGPGFFEDRSSELGLDRLTFHVLGFGTQFLDADRDGVLELFVANGHIDDLRATGRPYRMSPQLFRWNGAEFTLCPPDSTGAYFEQDWLGRAVVTLDWNGDGLQDLLIGHLDNEYTLLTNTTAEGGSGLSLQLTGVASGRDAIGTTVEVELEHRRVVRQLTAGDGYLASNERTLMIGTGAEKSIHRLTVRWPSGREQVFENVETGRRVKLTEGDELRVQ